ncbi:MAG: hypothetical protein RQ741_05160 [Wenzhouxiangellaceae bacterium]|nr:hypothetical protein [Wenzhouxiangellaceae bacterium]
MEDQIVTSKNHTLSGLLALGIALSSTAMAAEPVTPKLTETLDLLLRQEMRSIQAAMGQIHSAIVMGQHDDVANQAQQVHDSFILKQSLTQKDREDLRAAVPDGFLQMDQEFHELAAALAKAGRNKDTGNEYRIFNQMTRNCVECHNTYVSDRFPDLGAL